MKRWSIIAVALALALAMAAPTTMSVVGQTPSPTTAGQAIVRAVHAVPDAGPVNVVTSSGSQVFCNLPFKAVTRYVAENPGTFSFAIVPVSAGAAGTAGTPSMTGTPSAAGTPSMVETPTMAVSPTGAMTATTAATATGAMTATTAATATGTTTPTTGATAAGTTTPVGAAGAAGISGSVELAAGKAYSLVVVGTSSSQQTLTLTDDLTAPPSGKAKVRFVHASPDAPAVDVAVSGAATPAFGNVAFKGATDYATVDAGTVTLNVNAAGTSNTVLALPNVTLDAGAVYTIYAVGLANGTPSLQGLVSVESVGGMPVPASPLS